MAPALSSSTPVSSYKAWLSTAPALSSSAPLSSYYVWLFTAPALPSSVPLSSYYVWLFMAPAPARLLSALITSGSLRLWVFLARLLPALITSGSLRLRLLQRGSSQLFSTPAHTARYYIYPNIYTEPGKAYSDTSKVLYKEIDMYNLLRKKNQFLVRRSCCHTEHSTIAWILSLI
jgi:hypothetical protein